MTYTRVGGGLTTYAEQDMPSDGEAVLPRLLETAATITLSTGNFIVTFFDARVTEGITQVRIHTGTGAQTGATLIRVGIYAYSGSGNNWSLTNSTANDTTLLAAASTPYLKSLDTTFNKVRGTRYGAGILVVGATGSVTGGTIGNSAAGNVLPRIAYRAAAQTDLPSSFDITAGASQTNLPQLHLVR